MATFDIDRLPNEIRWLRLYLETVPAANLSGMLGVLAATCHHDVSCDSRNRFMYHAPIVCIMCAAAFSTGIAVAAGGSPTVAPYGSWPSPISPQMLVQG